MTMSYLIAINVAENNANSSNGLLQWQAGEITALQAVLPDRRRPMTCWGWCEPRIVEVTEAVMAAILAADWTGEMTSTDVEYMVEFWSYGSRAAAEEALEAYLAD